MKKILIFILFLFIIKTQTANAAIVDQPFGGQVSVYPLTGVVCPTGYGPFIINSVGISAPGPYLLPFASAPLGTGITIGSWVLGLYSPLLATPGGCVTTATTPVPFPTLNINLFQSSGSSFGL